MGEEKEEWDGGGEVRGREEQRDQDLKLNKVCCLVWQNSPPPPHVPTNTESQTATVGI